MVKIEEIFTTSLRQASKQHTADTLGDRSEYIGASEIGHCPRKVILDKLNPAEQSLTSLLRFERGHMAEDIVAKVFQAAGYPFERQHENIIPCSVPFRAHTDFVFTANKSKIKSILEVKSCTIPSEPYGSWESQLYTQMGAIAEEYPDYAVKGSILAIDLTSGQVALFSGYVPNEIIYKSLITKAEDIWTEYQRLRQGESLDTTTVPDPLCGFWLLSRICG